jgi:hypothetical protein
LKAAVYCFRLVAMITPLLGHQSSLAGGPVFGVHYNLLILRHRFLGVQNQALPPSFAPFRTEVMLLPLVRRRVSL